MNGDDKLIEPIASEQEDSQISLPSYDILTYPADYTLRVNCPRGLDIGRPGEQEAPKEKTR